MKKFLLANLVTFASAVGVTNPVFSQRTDSRIAIDNTEVSASPQPAGLITTINPKAIKAFRKNYNSVEGEIWSKLEDGYTAEFTSDGARFRVDYDNKGNWSGTTKGYTEAKLPQDIRTMIKNLYSDYNIFWVEEITLPYFLTGPIYFVHIEDENGFKNISVYNGELNIQAEYQKYQPKKNL